MSISTDTENEKIMKQIFGDLDDPKRNELDDEYRYTTQMYKGEKIVYPQSMSLNAMVKRIAKHNKLAQFTGINLIGQSGSGKSTLTSAIVDSLIQQGENYNVKWLDAKRDFTNMDKIIADLGKYSKGIPTILIFTDASYVSTELSSKKLAELAYALTTVRHITESRIITIMQIHYSKAMQKFFRNQHFSLFTSLGSEERDNVSQLLGNPRMVTNFSKKARNMMLNGKFKVPKDLFSDTSLDFYTNKPFRIALADELGWSHTVLYSKPEKDHEHGEETKLTTKDIVDKIEKAYGLHNIARPARYFSMIHGEGGLNCLDANSKRHWKFLSKVNHLSEVNWFEVSEEIERRRKRKHKKFGWRTVDEKDAMQDLENIAKNNSTENI